MTTAADDMPDAEEIRRSLPPASPPARPRDPDSASPNGYVEPEPIPASLRDPERVSGEERQARHQGAASAAKSRTNEETEKALKRWDELTTENPKGYLAVERIGPPGYPELGRVGKIPFSDLRGGEDVAEIIEKRFAGGEYVVEPHSNRGRPLAADPETVRIPGLKPTTPEGKQWLRDLRGDGQSSASDMFALVEKIRPPSDGGAAMIAALAPLFGALTSGKDKEEAREQRKHELELARIAAETERQRVEARERADRESAERKERAEKEERESKERIEKLRIEAKGERLAVAAERKADILQTKSDNLTKIRLAQLEQDGSFDAQLAKASLDKFREVAGSLIDGATGPDKEESLGDAFVGAIKEAGPGILKQVVGLFVENARRAPQAAPLRQLPPSPAVARPGPALPSRPSAPAVVIDRATGLPVVNRAAGPPAFAGMGAPVAAPPSTSQTAGTPFPVAPGGPVVQAEDVEVTEPVEMPPSPPADTVAVPTFAKSAAAAAANATVGRALAFLGAVCREMMVQSDAAEAWGAETDVPGKSVGDVYFGLPKIVREAVPEGWPKTREALATFYGDHVADAVDAIEKCVADESAAEWFGDFLKAGPWNEDEDDEE